MSGTRDWDAGTYDRVSTPQVAWARGVIDRLALDGAEVVLDAGCGSGRVTELLLGELGEGGCVIAVDGSEAMIEGARGRLGDDPRVRLVHSDLLDLDLDGEVDAIFSNAVFHWIADHARLFEVLHAALRQGGRLEAQCGGRGNVAGFYAALGRVAGEAPFREHLAGFMPNHFAGAEETTAHLERAGFEGVEAGLQPWPVRPPEPREFVRSVCIGAHSERLPTELREPYLNAVMGQLGPEPEFDYVRLNISARKP